MMALLPDPLFYYWTLTGDQRRRIVVKWCDFLGRRECGEIEGLLRNQLLRPLQSEPPRTRPR